MKIDLILDNIGASDIKRNSNLNQFCRFVKIRMVAHLGGFDNLADRNQIYYAMLDGLMPDGFDVHHIIPLCCSNTKITLDNMVIMDSSLHKFLHRHVYDVALRDCKVGEKRSVVIPDFDLKKVARYSSLDKRFIEKIRRKERE